MMPRTQLGVERLDGRVLPSVAFPVLPAPAHVGAAVAAPVLSGNASGHLHAVPGSAATLTGSADLAGIGHVSFSGTLTSVGNIASGHASGSLTLAAPGGTLTLALTGPQQAHFAGLPGSFHYEVTGGTGSFSGVHSAGTLYLNIGRSGYFTASVRPGTPAAAAVSAAAVSTAAVSTATAPAAPLPAAPMSAAPMLAPAVTPAATAFSGVWGNVTLGPTSPLAGAVVSVSQAGSVVANTTTDQSGQFRVSLAPGIYQLRIAPPVGSQIKGSFEITILVNPAITGGLSVQFSGSLAQ